MDSEDEQCRDVYSYFGLAIYAAQCLEQSIIHALVMMDHFPKAVPEYTTRENWESRYDSFYDQEASRTMGQLIDRLQKIGIPSLEIEEKLKISLQKQNWLAHSYFSHRTMEFLNKKGRRMMIKELEEARDQFDDIEKELTKITRSIAKKYGLTDEVFDRMQEEILREANTNL